MTWLTAREAATRARRHPVTVRRALACGELHGHQTLRQGRPVPGSPWQVAEQVVDAWIQGHDDHAQRTACGCPALRAVPRAS